MITIPSKTIYLRANINHVIIVTFFNVCIFYVFVLARGYWSINSKKKT